MNITRVLPAILMAAKALGAERVLVCRADAQGPGVILSPCDDPLIDRLRLRDASLEADEDATVPIFAINAVAPGWAIFVAGGTAHIKELQEWMPAPVVVHRDEDLYALAAGRSAGHGYGQPVIF